MEDFEENRQQHCVKMEDADFGRFIKRMEGNSLKRFQQHRDQLEIRQKLKENWLVRSKIMPPKFQYRQFDYSHESRARGVLKGPASYKNIQQTKTDVRQDDRVMEKHLLQKKILKSKHVKLNEDMGSISSSEKIRSNWKIQLRKDELNSLQFTLGEDSDVKRDSGNMLQTTISKSFKVRKIHGKLKEGSEVFQLLKVRLEKKSKDSKYSGAWLEDGQYRG